MNYHEAVEHAKTLAPQYGLGVRQQDALVMMLDRGRWPVSAPGTFGGVWICSASWSASLKMMTSLEGKGVVVPTGEIHAWAGMDYPMYVLADAVIETLPATSEPRAAAVPTGEPTEEKTRTAHEVMITFAVPTMRPDLLEALGRYVEFGLPLKDAIVNGGGTASITVNGTPIEEL